MKTFKFYFLLSFVTINAFSQRVEFGSDLNMTQPTQNMAKNMNNAFGIAFNSSILFKSPFSIGAEFSYAEYGNKSTRQKYTFDDGSVTETDVNVSNSITRFNVAGKYFLRNEKKVNPYLSGKAGWSWFNTILNIEDPEDEYSCHPIESDVLSRDNTYLVSGGVGVRVDFATVFKKMEDKRFYFDFNIHHTQGGIVRYMNVEKDPTQQSIPAEDVMAKFINTQTQVIHEHHVGYSYSNMVTMVEYKFGMVFRLNAR
jgi:hypothetical protein